MQNTWNLEVRADSGAGELDGFISPRLFAEGDETVSRYRAYPHRAHALACVDLFIS